MARQWRYASSNGQPMALCISKWPDKIRHTYIHMAHQWRFTYPSARQFRYTYLNGPPMTTDVFITKWPDNDVLRIRIARRWRFTYPKLPDSDVIHIQVAYHWRYTHLNGPPRLLIIRFCADVVFQHRPGTPALVSGLWEDKQRSATILMVMVLGCRVGRETFTKSLL